MFFHVKYLVQPTRHLPGTYIHQEKKKKIQRDRKIEKLLHYLATHLWKLGVLRSSSSSRCCTILQKRTYEHSRANRPETGSTRRYPNHSTIAPHASFNPQSCFHSTAGPVGKQTSQNMSNFSPKRDCSTIINGSSCKSYVSGIGTENISNIQPLSPMPFSTVTATCQ